MKEKRLLREISGSGPAKKTPPFKSEEKRPRKRWGQKGGATSTLGRGGLLVGPASRCTREVQEKSLPGRGL